MSRVVSMLSPVCLIAVSLFASVFATEKQSGAKPGASPRSVEISFDLADVSGQWRALRRNDARRPRVFVFLSTTCPISAAYSRELARLYASRPEGVEWYGVVAEPDVSRAEAADRFAELEIPFPILFDTAGLLAGVLTPERVPEAFVLDGQDRLAYRGAINNAYEAIGRRRANVEHHWLRDAVAAVARGERPPVARTDAVGCHFPDFAMPRGDGAVTYHRDVAPIIQSRCLACHREGEVAPFALTNFVETKRHARMIVETTRGRIMPPWMPAAGERPRFVDERRLSDRELEILAAWVDGGCAEGDPADGPVPPVFATGWGLGKPDLVVRMAEAFTVPAEGADLLRNFVIPIDIPEDKLVAAVEFRPGNKRVVHHAVLFLDDKKQARKLDAATPGPGYANFGGPGFLPSGALGGWSVGNTPRRLPGGMGRYLKRGSDLVAQVHYHPSGKEETDQSEIGLYFVDRPLAESLKERARLVGSFWAASYQLDIPAGDADYQARAAYRLPKEIILVGVVPHMHLLGKSVRVSAELPDGTVRSLVDIPRWNYNWQDEFYYDTPFRLPAGTTLVVDATFDNSAAKASNPSSPPQRVTWGDGTLDEMLFCFFLATADRSEDLVHTILDNLGHDLRQPRGAP